MWKSCAMITVLYFTLEISGFLCSIATDTPTQKCRDMIIQIIEQWTK